VLTSAGAGAGTLAATMLWPPIADIESKWRSLHAIRTQRRLMCERCHRPARVCVCDSLPASPLQPEVPILVLQHRREAQRKLASAPILKLCIDDNRCSIVVGRSLLAARKSQIWATALREGRTPLLLYPLAGAASAAAVRSRASAGERFLLVVIDGTWTEARELCRTMDILRNDEKLGCTIEALALSPGEDDLPRFAGCRKPPDASCLCTLEAVAMALKALEQSPEHGSAIATALLRPMLCMVDHQTVLTNGRETHRVDRPGYMPELAATAARRAATMMFKPDLICSQEVGPSAQKVL
jgi:DTW domain-containing protein YfiP